MFAFIPTDTHPLLLTVVHVREPRTRRSTLPYDIAPHNAAFTFASGLW